jgi:flagellar hook-basal body complex protein FliE
LKSADKPNAEEYAVNGIDALLFNSASFPTGNGLGIPGGSGDAGGSFSDIFSDIYDLAENTDVQDKQSVLSLLTGNVDDISDVMIDSEKAEIALSLTIEVRNKILDAYNEIMNMQV